MTDCLPSEMESTFREYYSDPLHEGSPPEDAYTGTAGGAACGDVVQVGLTVRDGLINSAVFTTEGCSATRAAAACCCDLVTGRAVIDAARIGSHSIAEALGGLTPAAYHAATLAADALHRALTRIAAAEPRFDERAGTGSDRVLVAVSGGVDSAVAALCEQEAGRDVVAVTVKLWADPETDGTKACCSPEAVLGARRLAHSLGLPHFTMDLEDDFRKRVVGRFMEGYAAGETPNPCVLCNGEVRLSAMIELGDRLGAEYLVTGHYARTVNDGDGPLLAEAADPAKDQGYMLAALPTHLLQRIRFPIGEMTKPEVREIARRHQLEVADKAESQDLCFLAGQGKRSFLERHADLADRPGPIVDRSGRVLGEHQGHHRYTVGQRRGLGIAATEALYVLETDARTNTVVVGPADALQRRRLTVRNATLHRDGAQVDSVRLRYRSEPVPARVTGAEGKSAPAGSHSRLEVELGEPFAGIAPGQAAVLFSGPNIVGHGTIDGERQFASASGGP